MRIALVAATAVSLLFLSAPAAMAGMDGHHHHAVKPAGKAARTPAVQAYRKAMKKMHRDMAITYVNDTDMDFTAGMIPHHQGAVDMAKIELQYGTDPDMRFLASKIIQFQEMEIGEMKHWLWVHNYPQGALATQRGARGAEELKRTMETMHEQMNISYTGNADIDFALGMIPHHQGAIDMAYALLRHGQNPQLIELSRGIIDAQTQEIALMRRWLRSRGVDTQPPVTTPGQN